jgi:hypothetical protein
MNVEIRCFPPCMLLSCCILSTKRKLLVFSNRINKKLIGSGSKNTLFSFGMMIRILPEPGPNRSALHFSKRTKNLWIVFFGTQLQGRRMFLYSCSKSTLLTQQSMMPFSNSFKEILTSLRIRQQLSRMLMFSSIRKDTFMPSPFSFMVVKLMKLFHFV